MIVEFWLSQDSKYLQLPVPPPSYTVKTSNNNISVVVESVGELNILGESKLSDISFGSFFPSQNYSFCVTSTFPTPKEYVTGIEKMRLSKKPIRLVLTGTPINDLFSIESFEYSQKDGTDDIYFNIALKQYKVIALNQKIVGTHGAAFTLSGSNSILGSNIL